ncbi:hypothetical protein GCM10008090_11430 [Arenicella chitinivorans]|uniref:HEAT repeat domain-containing protein n=1 Tax=Arenicella chitinivorans TaxID=1329800 RepID=A0A918RP78_9GAMM|nr:HEAT repeat domain-containing protein [Arenicella chitinivorans]GHA03888.1 hypothetical protein GCM10008090_11430 [Arenicella chitinivorans]
MHQMSKHRVATLILTFIFAQTANAKTNELTSLTADGWYQYRVPIADNAGSPCCQHTGQSDFCQLTASSRNLTINTSLTAKNLVILFKQRSNQIEDVVLIGDHCRVDSGGHSVKELTSVTSQQSLDMLQALSTSTDHHLATLVTAAIALHHDDDATQRLIRIAFDKQHVSQHDAIFWLGEARRHQGFQALLGLIENTELPMSARKQAVFALSLYQHADAANALQSLARTHSNHHIQKEAIFWVAESSQHNAFTLLNDLTGPTYPQSIQKEAVFGLSRLSGKRATPALINLVQHARSKVVREAALFWLGQSEDPDARVFLTQILTR